jgi:hypothetical protein
MKPLAFYRSIALAALTAVVLCACGNKESGTGGIAGTWKGDGSSVTNPTAKSMVEAMSLDLKTDKTFSASMGISMAGTWSETGKTVNLKLTKIAGNDIAELHKVAAQEKNATDDFDKPIVLELSPDGKTLTVTQVQTGPPNQQIVFKKRD